MFNALTHKPDFSNSEAQSVISVADLIDVAGALKALKNMLQKI
jgi:hypothetical protein